MWSRIVVIQECLCIRVLYDIIDSFDNGVVSFCSIAKHGHVLIDTRAKNVGIRAYIDLSFVVDIVIPHPCHHPCRSE